VFYLHGFVPMMIKLEFLFKTAKHFVGREKFKRRVTINETIGLELEVKQGEKAFL